MIPGFGILAYASAIEPLRAANVLSGCNLYGLRHLSATGAPVTSSSGATIIPDALLERAPQELDALFVCAGGNPASFRDRMTFARFRRFASTKRPVGGVAGGAYLLARAGLLNDFRFTLHWEYAASLVEEFPHLHLQRTLFEIDGNRLTCSGGTAPLDMMHAFLLREHGPGLARAVSDWLVQTDVRRGDQSQRMALPQRLGIVNLPTLKAVGAMEAHIEPPLTRAEVAASSGVSSRQLERLFRYHLGSTPGHYYHELRLNRARLLLRQTPLSIAEVAAACGFPNRNHFCRIYHRQFGASPTAERRALSGTCVACTHSDVVNGQQGEPGSC